MKKLEYVVYLDNVIIVEADENIDTDSDEFKDLVYEELNDRIGTDDCEFVVDEVSEIEEVQ